MTNTITKITYDGEDYKVGGNDYTAGTGISISASNEISSTVSGVPAVGTNGQVLTVVSGAAAWANASGGDVVVSSQTGNILQSGMKIWGGTETDYGNLATYDSNTLYLTIE